MAPRYLRNVEQSQSSFLQVMGDSRYEQLASPIAHSPSELESGGVKGDPDSLREWRNKEYSEPTHRFQSPYQTVVKPALFNDGLPGCFDENDFQGALAWLLPRTEELACSHMLHVTLVEYQFKSDHEVYHNIKQFYKTIYKYNDEHATHITCREMKEKMKITVKPEDGTGLSTEPGYFVTKKGYEEMRDNQHLYFESGLLPLIIDQVKNSQLIDYTLTVRGALQYLEDHGSAPVIKAAVESLPQYLSDSGKSHLLTDSLYSSIIAFTHYHQLSPAIIIRKRFHSVISREVRMFHLEKETRLQMKAQLSAGLVIARFVRARGGLVTSTIDTTPITKARSRFGAPGGYTTPRTRSVRSSACTPTPVECDSPSDNQSDVTSSPDSYRPVIAASTDSESPNSEPQLTPLGLWQKSEATINRQIIRSLHSTHHQRRGSFQQMVDDESYAFLRRTSSNTRRTATAVSVAARFAPVQTQMDMTNRHSNRASGNSYYYRDDDNDDYGRHRSSYSSRLSVNVGQSFSSGHYLLAVVTESDDDKKETAITDAVKSVSDDSDSPSQISAFQFSEGSIFENVPPPATHPSVNNGGDGGYYEWQKAQGGQIERGYQFWNTVGSSSQLNSNPTNQNVTTSHNDDARTAADEDKDDKESVHYNGTDGYDDYGLHYAGADDY